MGNVKLKRGFVGLIVVAFSMLVLTPIVWSGPIEEAVELL